MRLHVVGTVSYGPYDPCSNLQSILVLPLVSWALRKWNFGHRYVWSTGLTVPGQATLVKVSLLSRQWDVDCAETGWAAATFCLPSVLCHLCPLFPGSCPSYTCCSIR